MSRQAHLPPRCPFQKKPNLHPVYNPSLNNGMPLHRHHKSMSHSYLKEEQPAWLDDLLENPEPNSSGIMHRRSASDSLTLLDDDHLVSLTNFDHHLSMDTCSASSCETDGTSLKSVGSIYGPNSPRGKGNVTFQERSIVSALSEYVGHEYLDESFSTCRVSAFGVVAEDTCGSTGDDVKRHPGQRSRIRKLQYIAELERTVDMLQQNETDMAARVASLLQQRVSLSLENSKLKQKLVRLQQRKLFLDGQNRILRKEYEMLKVETSYGCSKKGSKNSSLGKDSVIASDEISWQMLDMGKLNLN